MCPYLDMLSNFRIGIEVDFLIMLKLELFAFFAFVY